MTKIEKYGSMPLDEACVTEVVDKFVEMVAYDPAQACELIRRYVQTKGDSCIAAKLMMAELALTFEHLQGLNK